MYFTPRAKTPCRINRLIRGNGAYIICNEFRWEREGGREGLHSQGSRLPVPFCPSLLSRRVLPHRPLHCSVGQSRLRLRRACGIARGARAFSPDRRDGPIRPNSHEFATEQAAERCCRPRGYKGESWNDAREEHERKRREHAMGVTKKGKKNPRAVPTSRFDLRGEVRSGRKESGHL